MNDQATKLRNIIKNIETKSFQDSAAKGRVIAVTSGKGGVGKTNIVTNLAIALASLGERVMILDADIGLANVDVLLNQYPRFNIGHVLLGMKKLEEIIVAGPGGIQIIPGGSGMVDMRRLGRHQLQRFIRELAKLQYQTDWLLIDTGAGISYDVISFALAADEIALIVTPEPTSLTDAYAVMKYMIEVDPRAKINLILNRVSGSSEAKQVKDKMVMAGQKFLNYNLGYWGYVLEDQELVKAVKRQTPLIIASPQSKAAERFLALASDLANKPYHKSDSSGMPVFIKKIVSFFG